MWWCIVWAFECIYTIEEFGSDGTLLEHLIHMGRTNKTNKQKARTNQGLLKIEPNS